MKFLTDALRSAIGFNPIAWVRYARQMRRRIAEFSPHLPAQPEGQSCLVVVTPWEATAIPWLSLVTGVMLAARGARVTFVIDDKPFGTKPFRYAMIVRAIRSAMRDLARRYPVITLSEVAPHEAAEGPAIVDKLARLNAVWQLRGEMAEEGRAAAEARNRAAIGAAYRHIAGVFHENHFDMMFVPGGVYGNSGLWVALARQAGVRVASYDNGGFGTWVIAADGLACHLGDIPRAVRIMRERLAGEPEERARVLAAAQEEISKRQQGTDIFEYQVKGSGEGADVLNGGIMLALNSSWDSAALGVHEVFASNQEWIVGSVRYLLENTDVAVVVRQHPAERLHFARTTDDYRGLLLRNFGAHPRLHFIAAEDPVNSYALLPRVAAVLVHSSTIGNEAAALGRTVVTASNAYYSDLGFVWKARTLEEYNHYLAEAAAGRLEVTSAMRDDARLCYYVTQVCNWVHSGLNPESFKTWREQPIEHWFNEPATCRMLDAVIDDVPVAILNHAVLPAGAPR